jgi:hypothetical protein
MERDPAQHAVPPGRDTVLLWLGVLAGPVLTLGVEYVAYVLVPDACSRHTTLIVQALYLVAFLGVVAGLLVCWRAWRLSGPVEPDAEANPEHRARFMAYSGILGNAFFALIVLGMWLATFLLSPCFA